MKKSVFISFILSLVIFSGVSFAVDVTIFGPKQYIRTTGEPNEYLDTFSALPKQGKLVIKTERRMGNTG